MTEKGCKEKVETYSRVCGYFSHYLAMNPGKQEEVKERKKYTTSGIK